jgi:putative membrane protein
MQQIPPDLGPGQPEPLDARREEAAPRHRLHWSSLFYGLGPVARAAVPVFLLLLAARDAGWQLWALVGLVPAAIAGIVRYLTLTYRFEPDELVIAHGLISRHATHVPYARIQHVELRQGPVQRALGVAEVIVHTGGGGEEPEAILKVLSLPRAEALRARLSRARGDARNGAGGEVILRLGARDLALCGLAEGRGWLVVGGAIGVLWQALDLFDVELPYRTWLSNDGIRRGFRTAWWSLPSPLTAILGIAVVVILFRALSVGWAMVKLHRYTLTRDGDLLRARYGLVTRFAAAIPRYRVQVLTVIETRLMRLLGRAAVKVETAARFATEQGSVGPQWLAPLIARDRLNALIGDVLPGIEPDAMPWQPVDPRGRHRVRIGFAIVGVLALAAAVTAFGPWSLLGAPAVGAWAWLGAGRTARAYAYAVTDRAVAFRSGWWTRRLSIVHVSRIQAVTLSESFLDRWWGMAVLSIDTAGATDLGHRVRIPYLARPHADRWFGHLRDTAARTDLVW